jgi:exopolysaccharide biosynthesis protein
MGDAQTVRKIFGTVPGGIVGMNGDFYSLNLNGPVVRNGRTYLSHVTGYWDIAVLDSAGVLNVYPYGTLKKAALKEMDAYQSWVFGPSLLDENGRAKTEFRSKVQPNNPRSVLGYYEPGHYAFLLVDGRSETSAGITMEALSRFCEELGFTSAYNLDGGQSSVLMSQNGAINNPFRGGRAVSDILTIRELPEG